MKTTLSEYFFRIGIIMLLSVFALALIFGKGLANNKLWMVFVFASLAVTFVGLYHTVRGQGYKSISEGINGIFALSFLLGAIIFLALKLLM